LLPLLRTSREQDDDRVAVSPEVHAIARAKIDLVFEHALSNALGVGEIALLHAGNDTRNPGACHRL
jgi:hypothetical protein